MERTTGEDNRRGIGGQQEETTGGEQDCVFDDSQFRNQLVLQLLIIIRQLKRVIAEKIATDFLNILIQLRKFIA